MTTKTKAHLAVLSTNLFFASNYSMVKYISPALIKPYALNLFRVGVSVILFWLVWLLGKTMRQGMKTEPSIKKQHWGRFVLCSLTGIVINQMLFIKGLTLTSTIHVSLLILCTPLMITIFAFWILREKLTVAKILGLLLGIGGSVLLILGKESSAHAENYLLGDLLIVINAISYAFYFILVRPLMESYHPVHVIRWIFTIGLVLMFPLAWRQFAEIKWEAFQPMHFASLAFIVIAATFIAYYFNVYGIQHLGAGVTGSYIYTQPVFAVIIATLILGEPLTVQKIIAGVFIFIGVYLVSRKK